MLFFIFWFYILPIIIIFSILTYCYEWGDPDIEEFKYLFFIPVLNIAMLVVALFGAGLDLIQVISKRKK